jgi:hypothetical protein
MERGMSFLSFIYRYGIWISIPAFCVFLFLLVLSISGVVRTIKDARLVSIPLVAQQDVEFKEAGRVVLAMEGPYLSRRFAKLDYELIGPDGLAVRSRPSLFRARSSTFTTAKIELRIYYLGAPGRHTLFIRNLGNEEPSDKEHRVVFTRPHLARSILFVVGIIFTSAFTIGSIVLFFLRLSGA